MSAFARIVDEIARQVEAEHGGVPCFARRLKEAEDTRFHVAIWFVDAEVSKPVNRVGGRLEESA